MQDGTGGTLLPRAGPNLGLRRLRGLLRFVSPGSGRRFCLVPGLVPGGFPCVALARRGAGPGRPSFGYSGSLRVLSWFKTLARVRFLVAR
jgi:hypothetical protein